ALFSDLAVAQSRASSAILPSARWASIRLGARSRERWSSPAASGAPIRSSKSPSSKWAWVSSGFSSITRLRILMTSTGGAPFGNVCNGPLGVVQLDKDRTQGVPGLGVLRVFRDGLLELRCRGFVVALLAQHNPELPMRTRVSRVDFQNRLEFGLRRVEITPQPEGLGQIIAILGAVRSERDRLSQGLD